MRLQVEVENVNARWKLASEVIVLKAVREAFWTKSAWSSDDELAFLKSVKALKDAGIPLETIGIQEQDIRWPSMTPPGEEVH